MRSFRWVQADASQDVGKPRIGMKGTKTAIETDGVNCSGVIIYRAIQPSKCFVRLAEGYINRRDCLARKITVVCCLNQLRKRSARFVCLAEASISNGESGGRSTGRLFCSPIKVERLWQPTLLAIDDCEVRFEINVIRINLGGVFSFRERFVQTVIPEKDGHCKRSNDR